MVCNKLIIIRYELPKVTATVKKNPDFWLWKLPKIVLTGLVILIPKNREAFSQPIFGNPIFLNRKNKSGPTVEPTTFRIQSSTLTPT